MKRLPEADRYDLDIMTKMKGLPWQPIPGEERNKGAGHGEDEDEAGTASGGEEESAPAAAPVASDAGSTGRRQQPSMTNAAGHATGAKAAPPSRMGRRPARSMLAALLVAVLAFALFCACQSRVA